MGWADGLAESPEGAIVKAFFGIIANDTWLKARCDPILLIESPTDEALLDYRVNTLVVVPLGIKAADHPSQRSTVTVAVGVIAYIPPEQKNVNADLVGLKLHNHLRKIAWNSTAFVNSFTPDATVNVQPRPPILRTGKLILPFHVEWQTDIDPTTGDFV